ncbi:molybdenum cofactor biosynthesis protein MoaE [Egibacter rhizosphaerae]|uniref:molybdenum cofactor biosynthesis protein MoaE n=1 Tax=Egibacter rhizosphaerae TaxID=1670831 RepID=UPI0013F177FA|nr:molybdenum cofactor biosynthesis protein MoaE [Egibacter rhizosphaerae]
MPARTHAALTSEPLSTDAAHRFCADPAAGAVVVFVGAVREQSEGRAVTGLSYEAYVELANAQLVRLAEELALRDGITAVWMEHRVGSLGVEEPSVVVGVSAAHRPEAFAAAREGIDRLKAEVPIWKQEHWADGDAHWPGTT